MRKKSHILLARYLADQMDAEKSLQQHRKAFCLGNILPDIQPSFLTKKHEFTGTFGELQEKLGALAESDPEECKERVFWRRVGEILHYIADYFTYPHNSVYSGGLIEHSRYEKVLKNTLKDYIRSGEALEHRETAINFVDLAELSSFIRERHECYLRIAGNIADDIRYILSVCFQVVQGLVGLCVRYSQGYGLREFKNVKFS